MPSLQGLDSSTCARTFLLLAMVGIFWFIASPLHAGCPANLSVTGPDANGMVTVIASTTGQCDGASELDLTLDGAPWDQRNCPGKDCSYSNTFFAACMKAGAHTIALTAKCPNQFTDP